MPRETHIKIKKMPLQTAVKAICKGIFDNIAFIAVRAPDKPFVQAYGKMLSCAVAMGRVSTRSRGAGKAACSGALPMGTPL